MRDREALDSLVAISLESEISQDLRVAQRLYSGRRC
jgi:hypothetical protein